jgi:hypothetical protein
MAETYYFNGTDCTYSVTVLQTILAGGNAYYAPQEVISPQSRAIPITFQYASLTLAKLASAGPTAIFVRIPKAWSNIRLNHGSAVRVGVALRRDFILESYLI